MKWTSQQVAKRMFDTSVTPHWLESGERFWYTYETGQGRKYWLVDCRAKTRKPLFDAAHMAAMLTQITLSPYDAQHLPIRTVKFIKKDTALLFELDIAKDATVRVGDQFKTVQEISDEANKSDDMQDKSKEKQTDKQNDKGQGKTDTKTDVKTDDKQTTTGTTTQAGRGTRAGAAGAGADAAATTKTLFFEYDLKTENLALLPTYKAPAKKMLWASVSPDEKTIVFARGHNLFMMDAGNYALAQKKANDKAIKETQLTTNGEQYNSYARTLKEENKVVYQAQEKDRKDYRVPAIGIAWSKELEEVRSGARGRAQGRGSLADQFSVTAAPELWRRTATACPAKKISPRPNC